MNWLASNALSQPPERSTIWIMLFYSNLWKRPLSSIEALHLAHVETWAFNIISNWTKIILYSYIKGHPRQPNISFFFFCGSMRVRIYRKVRGAWPFSSTSLRMPHFLGAWGLFSRSVWSRSTKQKGTRLRFWCLWCGFAFNFNSWPLNWNL